MDIKKLITDKGKKKKLFYNFFFNFLVFIQNKHTMKPLGHIGSIKGKIYSFVCLVVLCLFG